MEKSPPTLEPTPYIIHLPVAAQNVLAVGALGVALGILGLCTLPMIAEPVTSEYFGRGGVVPDHGAINTWGLISTNAGCALSALMIVGGMGCLRLNAWARPVMISYGLASVLLGIAGVYFHILILRTIGNDDDAPMFSTHVWALAEWVAWAVGTCFGAWTLWVMTRPETSATMGEASGESSALHRGYPNR